MCTAAVVCPVTTSCLLHEGQRGIPAESDTAAYQQSLPKASIDIRYCAHCVKIIAGSARLQWGAMTEGMSAAASRDLGKAGGSKTE